MREELIRHARVTRALLLVIVCVHYFVYRHVNDSILLWAVFDLLETPLVAYLILLYITRRNQERHSR